ncbi:MaoC dehydratase-like protein [Prauserella shujinwangii]|uniref:MaoC dehydratase-like protein n=1 Tax=Prauserella shujinwangii TaxID=1453103 RepID=A0A2T0M1K9_9PSEU|nr:MaoC family dehydratase N-terminal domain-containing protein [Prauserella shujinwangii]PRX50457.1 MaoC dehydratase-like protein [Prauserella shujinwangii]
MTSPIRQCYDAVRETIGQERAERLGRIDSRDVRRFTVAVRGEEPRPEDPVHPLFLTSILHWGTGPGGSGLRPDGLGPDDTHGLPVDEVRVMGAGQEIVVHRRPEPGTVVTIHTSVTDADYRHGRTGELLIVRVRRRFGDDSGADLVTCHETFLAR